MVKKMYPVFLIAAFIFYNVLFLPAMSGKSDNSTDEILSVTEQEKETPKVKNMPADNTLNKKKVKSAVSKKNEGKDKKQGKYIKKSVKDPGKAGGIKNKKIEAVLNKIKRKQSGRVALEAEIIIKNTFDEGGSAGEVKGHVIIKKGNKFNIHYTEPSEQYLMSDGKTLWVYTPVLNQVIRQPAESASLNINFYIEIERSIDYFIKQSRTKLTEEKEDYIFDMRPKNKKKLDFDRIIVKISKESTIPDYMSLKYEGTLTEVKFMKVVSYNAVEIVKSEKFNDDKFNFEIPAGAEVIDGAALFGNEKSKGIEKLK